MAAAAQALRLRALVKRYGAETAVDGVDLEVRDGEFLCLVGPSGCGKSTLLRLVAGLEEPDAGAVEILGRDVAAAPPAARGVGMVFQSYALFPNLTALENVAFGLRGPGAERRRRAAGLLERVGLGAAGGRLPRELSGGQQQRVAIARAMACEPRVLLLDEPLSALDPTLRESLRLELRELHARLGLTSVMVTHDQAEALAVADRLAVMRAGRVVQIGSPAEIYDRPVDAFVAGFVGPANLIRPAASAEGRISLFGAPVEGWERADACDGGLVLIRPEAVRLGRADGPEAGPGARFRARVLGRAFLGAVTRLTLEPLGVPGARLLADAPGASGPGPALAPGDEVAVRLPADRLRLVPVAEARR